MKRLFIVVLILFLLLGSAYLFFLNKRIEGVWILNHTTDNNQFEFKSDGQGLWDIENQKIYYYNLSSLENVRGSNYFDFGVKLNLESEENVNNFSFKVNQVKGDSLVLNLTGSVQREIVLKKIPDTLKNNSDWKEKLTRKAFEFRIPSEVKFSEFTKIPKSYDTIYFDSQFIMHKNQIQNIPNWESPSWNLAKIKGLDVMFAHNWPTMILTENTDGIAFYGYDINGKMFRCDLNEIKINIEQFKNSIRSN
ncbi:hypothetical protein [Maribacter sp. 2308TA10-17]|uniref:hypothetical protein n=1 Tax=Maribacter sp. 2308TA10-17 TaxID=3386276 RepID=UPI0039BD1A7F